MVPKALQIASPIGCRRWSQSVTSTFDAPVRGSPEIGFRPRTPPQRPPRSVFSSPYLSDPGTAGASHWGDWLGAAPTVVRPRAALARPTMEDMLPPTRGAPRYRPQPPAILRYPNYPSSAPWNSAPQASHFGTESPSLRRPRRRRRRAPHHGPGPCTRGNGRFAVSESSRSHKFSRPFLAQRSGRHAVCRLTRHQ